MKTLSILRLTFFALPLFALISCGYKLGGLEVIGDNQDKVAEVKILSPNNFKQSFINAGFTISSDNFLYLIKIEGPTYSKETTSVTSNATENEFTITGKIEVSLEDNKGNIIIQNKVFLYQEIINFHHLILIALKVKKIQLKVILRNIFKSKQSTSKKQNLNILI